MSWLAGIVVALALVTIVIAVMPKGQAKVGLIADRLSPCPTTPNCVCSEDTSASAYIEPFLFNDSGDSAWRRAKQAVVSSGGRIQSEDHDYLWATFTTRWLRFVDDVELRLDADNQVIQVRSASRVGRSDFGVNRKRVENIRLLFNSAASGIHNQ